jgi:sulfide:quinone oxidoreductase
MVVPPFTGVDAVRGVDGLGNAAGFIPVDDEFRHPQFEDIYSADLLECEARTGRDQKTVS